MLKKDITYKDFDDNEVTETFYFNLTEPEIVDLEVEVDGGLGSLIETVMKTDERKTLVDIFKKVILISYGQRSEDGRRFIKSDQLSEEFSQTAAFPALYMELLTVNDAAADFFLGIIPSSIRDVAMKELEKNSTTVQNAAVEAVSEGQTTPPATP